MISKFTIQKIMDEARVEDIVGEFVNLKKRGSNLLGLCPFHNEKTPSFNVNPARNIYKCFGCGKAGDPVRFLMDYQQLSYPDALKYIAKKYNIEVEEEYRSDEEKQKEAEAFSLTESIHIANAYAQKFYSDYMLNTESGRIGLAYLKERGFIQATIDKFQLGFSPEGGDVLTKQALKDGFQLDVLKKAGITSPKENSTYDFFRNRVMFPIHNMTGKVVGFGGRIMIKDEKAPKYVNTSESEVYQKSKILYGAYFAKNEIRKKDECLMVEGYTDVISLYQAGIENVVASSGTALTVDQIRLIKRITPNITMLYDGDAAGVKAALRGTDLILEEGMNVRIVVLPSPEDPDSYVKKVGAEGFGTFIKNNRKDLISFKASIFADEAKSDPIKKAQLIRDIIDSIAKVPDAIQRSVYVKECAQLFDMNEQILITETNKVRRKKQNEAASEERKQQQIEVREDQLPESVHQENLQPPAISGLNLVERDVIRILLEFGNWEIDAEGTPISVTAYVLEELDGIDMEHPLFKKVLDDIRRQFANGQVNDDQYFISHHEPDIASLAIDILSQPYSLSENWTAKHKIIIPDKKSVFVKDILSAVLRFKQFRNIAELKKVEQLLREIKDEAEITRLMKLHILLTEQKKEFAKSAGNVIYRPTT
ncbi:MAG: DNA primase [Bacteroidetes bacterium]|nr:DNA primase [Bacteroidota bacterium]